MKFEKISNTNTDYFTEFWIAYQDSFPPNERREFDSQKKVFLNKHYTLKAIFQKDILVGFIAFWELNDFIFLEHYIILKSFRKSGYGSEALKQLIDDTKCDIILEVEKPDTEIAVKRINFYHNNGFHLNTHEYKQPSYGMGKDAIDLLLMSYPKPMNKDGFLKIRTVLYAEVYEN